MCQRPNPDCLASNPDNVSFRQTCGDTLLPRAQSTQSSLDDVPLESKTGVDYKILRELLRQQQWRKADGETARLMLQATGRIEEGWLKGDNMDWFPCVDLRTLDRLWVAASGGKFGFSVRREMWLKLGGQVDYETEKALEEAVGWRKNHKWLTYISLTFDLSAAPNGHLPACWEILGRAGGVWYWADRGPWGCSFAKRALSCNL
ncbi:MAG: GUN4 domain-containing protein [Spirulinaceae cyanobacterium]